MQGDFVKRSYKISVKENLSLNVYNTGYQRCEAGYAWGARGPGPLPVPLRHRGPGEP